MSTYRAILYMASILGVLASSPAWAAIPTVSTTSATGITATAATLNGAVNPNAEFATGWFRYDTVNPTVCDDVFGTRVPTSGGTGVGAGTTSAAYSISATGLLPGTTYFFCAIGSNASGMAFGAVLSFTTPALVPTTTTVAATNLTSSAATLNGTANPNGAATTGWFRYSTGNPGTCNDAFGTRVPTASGTALGSGNAAAPYNQVLSGLLSGATYYFCAIANNPQGTTFGTVLSFTTLVAAPTVTTSPASGVGGYSATLNGSASPNGAAATGWFRYDTVNPGGCNDAFGTRTPASGGTALGSGSTAISFWQSATLIPGTTYYFCAISSNSVGTSFGSVLTFTTPDVPTVTTSAVTALSATGATLNGSAIPNGSAATGWFRYSSTNPGTCGDTFGTRIPWSGGTALGAGSTSQPFSQAVTGLLPGNTYYYCAIAQNSVGTGFGALLTFTTPPAAPTVATNSATAISGTGATLNGQGNPSGATATGYFRYSTTNPITCNDTFGTRAPVGGGTALGSGNLTATFAEILTGLAPGTTYYFCAIAQNSVGTSFGSILSFVTPNVPTVTTVSATGLTGTSATLAGTANPNNAVTTAWFRFDTIDPLACNDTFGTRWPATGGSGMGSGASALTYYQYPTGLMPGTTYFYCAIAQNSVGTGFGQVLTFTTPAIPAMTTTAVTNLTATTVTLTGTGNPNLAATVGWFRYYTADPVTCSDTGGTRVPSVSGGSGLGSANAPVSYSQNVTGLLPGTTYWYCAIGSNVVGTGYGTVVTFSTPPTAPIVSTLSATNVTGTSATVNGQANPRGAAATGWFRYATVNPVTCNDTFGTRAPAAVGTGTGLGSGNTTASYGEPLTGLLPGTTYYYCAIASNSAGTGFGTVYSFVTPNIPTMTTTAATGITGTSAQLNGTGNPNNGATTGWFRYSTTNPGTCDDIFGTRAPATTGTSLGSGTSAWSYWQSITGLTPGTTYYYCAIGSNLVGTGFGAVLSFTTPNLPTMTTSAASAVTATTATLNGSAIAQGASAIGWFRYATTDPVTCNDTFGTRTPWSGGTSVGSAYASVSYTASLTGLLPGTTYFFCAIGSNVVGTGFGQVLSFTTPATAPVVSTSGATSLTSNSATLNGWVNPGGAASSGWFRYDTVNPVTCNDTFGIRTPASGGTTFAAGNSSVGYSSGLTGLALATTYYYCAIAQNSVGTSFGSVLSFTTSALAPAVTTQAASGVTTSQATMNASAIPNGASATGWFRYSPTNPGSCSDTFGTRAPATGGTALGSGTASQTYSVTPTTLSPGVTYYFCAIASNSVGTSFGAVLTFTTAATAPTTLTLAASGVGGTAATFNGSSNPNGASTTGWFRYDTVNPTTCSDTFGTRTPGSGGSALGSGTAATAYNAPITGLTPGTTYFFCAISQNSVGTTFGNVLTFATPNTPTVNSAAATPVTATTATLNATAVANGSAATGWFRYDTVFPTTCSDTFGTRVPATGGTALGSGSTTVNFAQALSGLMPGTTYYFCALASNAVGTTPGGLLSFTTPAAAPLVQTVAASAIGSTGATLNANVTANGAATNGWFRYATTNPGSCNDTFGTRAPATGGTALGTASTPASLALAVTGLAPATTYYFCPIAQNAAGTSFGGVMSFTTIALPIVSTSPATSVTITSATLNGSADPNLDATTAWFRYSTTNPLVCDDTFGTRTPASGGTAMGSGTAAVAYSQAITGLAQGTTYFFCAIAQNSVGTAFGSVLSFTTPNTPSVITAAATAVGSTSATLNGTANPNGAASTAWFRYATANPGNCNDTFGTRFPTTGGTALAAGNTALAFSQTPTGLLANTTYFYCALASNAAGTAWGTVQSFTTQGAPTVTTSAATALTTSTATLNGSAIPNLASATGFFRYSSVNPINCNTTFGTRQPATGGTALGAGSTAVTFSENLTGLVAGTTYYYCAQATNAVGTSLGTLLSFTVPMAPTVTTSAATAVSGTAATLNGSANPRGDATNGWFRYSTTNPGACSDTFGTAAPASPGTSLGAGTAAATYSQSITGLTKSTTYYYCAIAANSFGTSFGTVLSFTTPAAPAVTTSAATLVGASTATFNGSANPNLAATTAWFRYDIANPGTCDDVFGTRAPASSGAALGSGSTAVNTSLTVSGLAPGTQYFYCAIASNSEGTSFGTIQTFTTLLGPAVTTVAASGVASTSATLNGSTNPNGQSTTGWFRYSTVNPGSCSDTFGTRMPATAGTGTALGAGTAAVAYSRLLTGLLNGTTYYYCAISSNAVATSFGAVLSFTTTGSPTAITVAASAIGTNGATLNGTSDPRGADATGWFRYSTTNPLTCNGLFGTRAPATGGTTLLASGGAAPYQEVLTGLAPATTYYYCAIASNSVGTGYGNVLSFTTPAGPVVTTSAATGVTATGATLNGSANPKGTAASGWFRYDTVNPGSCNDTFGTAVPVGGTSLGAGTTAVAYSTPVTGLSSGTTYYFCAIAQNTAGTAFGTVQTFVTPGAPTVTTAAVTAIGGTSATLNGSASPNGAAATGWFRYSATDPGVCDDTFGTRTPATGGSALGSGTVVAAYSQPISGLTAGTTYFYCAIASNSVGTSFGAVLSFTTLAAPTVTTDPATSLAATSATLNGSANPRGASSTGWFRYSATDPGACNDAFGTRSPSTGSSLGSGMSAAPFSQPLSGLAPGTTYYFCAIASNSQGTSFGSMASFTTPAAAPTVTTSAATALTGSSATLNGSAIAGGAAATGWFRYSTTSPGTCDDTFGTRAPASGSTSLGSGNSAASFTEALTGLSRATTYYFCAIAQNSVGTSFGSVLSFTTAGPPAVTTTAASSITGTSAALAGIAKPNGADTTGWFRYSKTDPGTCDDTFGTRQPASGGAALGAGTSDVPWADTATGLSPGTTYYYCAIASNSEGIAYGTVATFKTLSLPTVTTSSISNLINGGATLNGTAIPNGSAATGWFRVSSTDPGSCNDTFGTRAPATGGSTLGAGTGQVGFSQKIIGLQPGVKYFFCAIASNTAGTGFGQVVSFTSEAPTPVVTTLAASQIGGREAVLNGTANPQGTSGIGWFRYDTKPGVCIDTFGTRVPEAQGLPLGSGNTAKAYSVAVTGLLPSTHYYFCAIASNLGGAGFGKMLDFTTAAVEPSVTTQPAAVADGGTATLNGSVNPNGSEATVWFQWGAGSGASCQDLATRLPQDGTLTAATNGEIPFSEEINGLSAGTYSYCAVAQGRVGTTYGEVVTFEIVDGVKTGCGCGTQGTQLPLGVIGLALLGLLRQRQRVRR